jgi:hypothetical protein
MRGYVKKGCELSGTVTFTIVPPISLTGSAYFTLETIMDNGWFYDGTSNTTAIGTYNSFVNCTGLVTSSYVFSVAVGEGTSSFAFTPSSPIPSGTAIVRGTGGITLEI